MTDTRNRSHSQRGGSAVKLTIIILAVIAGVAVGGGLLLSMFGGNGSDGGSGSADRSPNTDPVEAITESLAAARLATCQANLKSLGIAMHTYRMDANDRMPVMRRQETVAGGANSTPTASNVTDFPPKWEALGDQAMQNVWLLMASDSVAEGVFKCPGDKDWENRDRDVARYGWTDPRQYSYGMQWPYAQDAAGNKNPARLGAPSTVMFADQSPGGPVGGSVLPSNHRTKGTVCVLSSGALLVIPPGSSDYDRGGNDDIYTNDADVAGGLPQGRKDTSITLSGR